MGTPKDSLAGGCAAPQTAGIVFGGGDSTGHLAETEEYNGSGWSEVANLNTAREILGGAGTGEISVGEDFIVGSDENYQINTLQFQGSHLIYEHEYQCTISENEFNSTYNLSARKIKSKEKHDLADFTTSSLWSPYITTVGLYNEEGELLVVGKLAQPVKCSDETDTTFVLRWDT